MYEISKACIYLCVCVYMHVCICVCLCVSVCLCVCMQIHRQCKQVCQSMVMWYKLLLSDPEFSKEGKRNLLEFQTKFMTGPGKMNLLSRPAVTSVCSQSSHSSSSLGQFFLSHTSISPIIPHLFHNYSIRNLIPWL